MGPFLSLAISLPLYHFNMCNSNLHLLRPRLQWIDPYCFVWFQSRLLLDTIALPNPCPSLFFSNFIEKIFRFYVQWTNEIVHFETLKIEHQNFIPNSVLHNNSTYMLGLSNRFRNGSIAGVIKICVEKRESVSDVIVRLISRYNINCNTILTNCVTHGWRKKKKSNVDCF